MKKIKQHARNLRRSIANRYYGAQAALGTAIALSPLAAMAQSDLGAAVKTEVEGGKTAVTAILMVLAAVLGLFLLWSMIKRAK